MTALPDGRLQRLLGAHPLASLRRRVRQRFERAAAGEALERFRISNLTAEEHAVLASLLGHPVRFRSSMQVDVQAINDSLRRAGLAKSLRDALEQIDGPIIHLETSRQQLEALWSGIVSDCNQPKLISFLQTAVGLGLLKRLSDRNPEVAGQLCSQVDTVLQALPANGMTRAELAANTLGDAHALDSGRAVATMVLAIWRDVVATLADPKEILPDSRNEPSDQREIANERVRDIWARAGVLVNELARPVLLLNLCACGNPIYSETTGEPSYASLRFLLRSPPSWTVGGQDVFVCEIPNLLAIAADKLGAGCAPLICTDGMPAAAQRTLLGQLAQAGAHLWYHGDFDWPGVRIANYVIRQYGAQAWRFGTKEYKEAVQSAPGSSRRLEGPKAAASWDEALMPAMQTHQLAIAEEGTAASLLEDLAY